MSIFFVLFFVFYFFSPVSNPLSTCRNGFLAKLSRHSDLSCDPHQTLITCCVKPISLNSPIPTSWFPSPCPTFLYLPLTGISEYISLQQIKWGYSLAHPHKSLSSALCLQSLNFGFVLSLVVPWMLWHEDKIKKHFSCCWMVGDAEPWSWNGN